MWAETSARREDDVQLAQHTVEQLPARQAVWCFHPDVRRIDSSEGLHAGITRRIAKDFGISHVMIDERTNLFTTIAGIQRFGAALYRISNTVRFRAPTTLPKRMQRQPTTIDRPREYRFRHHCKPTAHTGEPAVFGKTPQFDRALACAGNLKNRMRNFRIGNVRLIRGIEEQ